MLTRKQLRRACCGVSLIELMVIVAVIGVIAALGVPSYNTWIQNTRIRAVAESIQSGLQLARAEAVRRNALVQFVLEDSAEWTVGCVMIVDDLDGDGVDDCPAEIQKKQSGEAGSVANITIAIEPEANNAVVFNGMGIISGGGFDYVEVDIDESVMSADDSRELRVLLETGGSNKLCDPNASDTDPRAC